MSATPVYMGTVIVGRASLSVANTARDGSGTLVIPTWGGCGGGVPPTDWQLLAVEVAQTGDAADSVVTLFSTDGTTIRPWRDIDINNPSAVSATGTMTITLARMEDWTKFPAGWDLRIGITVAPVSGVVEVVLFGERA